MNYATLYPLITAIITFIRVSFTCRSNCTLVAVTERSIESLVDELYVPGNEYHQHRNIISIIADRREREVILMGF